MWQEQTLIGWNLKAYSNLRKLSDLQSNEYEQLVLETRAVGSEAL